MSGKTDKDDGYLTIRIPKGLVADIDKLIDTHGFTSRAEIIKEASRQLIEKYAKEDQYTMLNHDSRGVKVRDNILRGVADVQFTPKGIYCALCDASKCAHVRFALNQKDVLEIVRKKQKEGWKIELPDDLQ